MERKVIQISYGTTDETDTVCALCNDGSVWELYFDHEVSKRIWKRLPDIPQPAPAARLKDDTE